MTSRIGIDNPPRHSAPCPFWFWNGTMNADEIKRQMRLMREAGITEFLIHGRYGLKTEYLSEDWFAAVRAAVDEAKKTGMRAWLYDELNWPSGSAGGKVTADRGLCEHYIGPDGNLRLTTAADISPDYLNGKATQKFISFTHEEYRKRFGRHFGSTIPGFFNDEVRFENSRPWSATLGKRILIGTKYFKATAAAISRNYFRKLSRWCGSRKMKFIGHVMGEETVGSNVRYMSDIFSCLAEFHEPGIDHLGKSAEGFHHRPAATVGRLFDRPVTCEMGGGLTWDFCIQDLYRISGWLYANGVTRIIPHAFFYEENQSDWPPDMFFRWKGWPDMAEYIAWAGKIQYFLSIAKPVRKVSLYYPLEEFWSDFKPDPAFTLNFGDKGPVVTGAGALAIHRSLQELSASLYSRNIDFDLVPRRWLGKVRDSVLIAPADTDPAFGGQLIRQKGRSSEETVSEVERILGPRPSIRGKGVNPGLAGIRDNISDPYIHESKDLGGVLIREYLFQGRKAWMVWNAGEKEFTGQCVIPALKEAEVRILPGGSGPVIMTNLKGAFEISLPSRTMAVILA